MANSFYDPAKNEVAALEDLIGAHGGAGGYQNRPFIMYPASWSKTPVELYGAGEIHEFLSKHL